MDTFDLLPTLAAGELAQTSAPELVAAIFRSRASGTLSIEGDGGVEIRQFFRGGDMCGSAFFAGFRTLAQVLLANDWVNALEIDASRAEAQAANKRHGQVLVEKGLLNADQLKQALYTQHKQNLLALLGLDRGHYELRGWEPPPPWSKELSIDPVGALVESFETERMGPRRLRVLDWLGSHSARLSVEWPELSAKVQLDSAERRAAALLALPRRLGEFVTASRLPQARAEALLVTLLLTGGVEAHPGSGVSQAAPVSAPPPASAPVVPHYVPSTAPPPEPEQDREPVSEPILVAGDARSGESPELVAIEAEAPQKPMAPATWVPSPAHPPQARRNTISPGMPLFSRPSSPPRPGTSPGYSISQPPRPLSSPVPPAAAPAAAPEPLFEAPRPKTNPGYLVDQQPQQRPATSPGFPAPPRPTSNPALKARPASSPNLKARPAPPSSAGVRPPAPPPAPLPITDPNPQLPTTPIAEELAPAPPPVLRDDDAFARLESLAMEELGRSQAAQQQKLIDEASAEVSHSGLRRLDGGGFEVDGKPIDSTPGLDQRGARSAASAADAAAQDDASMALRKKMRARGMRNLGTTGPMAPLEPEHQGGFAEENPAAAPPLDEAQLSQEDRRFLDEVRSKAKLVGDQDAWQRLGVARSATSDQIRGAYLEAAKRYHPDLAGAPGLAGVQDELRTLFSAVKEAYDLIATAPARESYLAQLKTGTTGKVQARKDEAALALRMGEVLLKKRDFQAALSKLRRSVELDPNGDALAALAWGLMCDPATSPAGKEEAAGLINRALRATGLSARTYYVAGVLWRTKDPDSAADAFRKALELEPNHADASLELRLLEMRQGKKSSGGGVLSTLLFGKKR